MQNTILSIPLWARTTLRFAAAHEKMDAMPAAQLVMLHFLTLPRLFYYSFFPSATSGQPCRRGWRPGGCARENGQRPGICFAGRRSAALPERKIRQARPANAPA
jgi:hypothetical protein